ncbi:MAG TPA: regulatory protein RecX [Steroidobacteraceae bacterium]
MRKRPRKRRLAPGQSASPAAAGSAAVALLARRDFCCEELREVLVGQGFEPDTVQGLLVEFMERGYVNDARYAQQFVALHAERGHGPLRIQRELAQRGLDAALIEAALTAGADWAQRARELRIRRFGLAAPTRWPERAKQARFLQYRGFSIDHIRSALGADVAADLDSS